MRKPGRQVICSKCSHTTAEGTTQIYRKLVFHFCVDCWNRFRASCQTWMQQVAA